MHRVTAPTPRLHLTQKSDPSASYEKELQQLQSKLAETEKRLLSRRLRLRRSKGLFTLYSVFVYIVYVGFVVAKSQLSRAHLLSGDRLAVGVVLGPVGIFCIRYVIQAVLGRFVIFDEDRVKYLRRQQEGKLEELKQKTGFYSTKAIVDRYEPKKEPKKAAIKKQMPPGLKGVPPPTANVPRNLPPTANVPRPQAGAGNIPATANIPSQGNVPPKIPVPVEVSPSDIQTAKASLSKAAASPVVAAPYQRQWFDRVLDLLVGEDENAAQNRNALICSKCNNHNGLAPFGKNASEIRYKCPVCGEWNGEKPALEEAKEVLQPTEELEGQLLAEEELEEEIPVQVDIEVPEGAEEVVVEVPSVEK